ncbi:hemerythrin domain-containing protein [Aquabacterium sp.]|uniref:hemerythrin domain-containing protein n=1 Tax=Aquabacterium sp. TaxID=1872578 RepID=UPI0035B042EF
MPLTWKPEFVLNQPQVDATHREFVDLVACLDESQGEMPPAALVDRFKRLIAHTIDHFGQEDRWMTITGFSPDNCHARQHKMVLDVMHEVVRLAEVEGHLDPLRRIVLELEEWFPQHADMMDAALVFHMSEVGFDPARPDAFKPKNAEDADAIKSCDGSSCG